MKNIFAICLTTLCLVFTSAALAQEITIDELTTMSQDDLDTVYLNAKAGPIPNGVSTGTARFFPDSILDGATQQLAYLVWQGKVFEAEDGYLINRVAGFRAVVAELYYGDSILDGGESVIIDYSNTSLLFGSVRDEIRQVSPTIYLGRAYINTLFGSYMAVNFILQFDEPQVD